MDLIQQALPEFLAGARDTFIYCVISFPLALLLGMILALMSNSRLLLLRGPARTFIEIIRTTTILVQLLMLLLLLLTCFSASQPHMLPGFLNKDCVRHCRKKEAEEHVYKRSTLSRTSYPTLVQAEGSY